MVLVESHSRGSQLLHEDLEGSHSGVPRGVLRSVKVAELSHRSNINVVPEMCEHRRGNAPLCAVNALLIELGLTSVEGVLGALRVNNLVEAREDIATCDVLERGS